jgi:NOL1/NOP2/sun family putative RNA methylase
MYSLQESASQYPVQVLNPSSSDRVLDMASAPGGKTTQMAAYMQNQGIVVAVDINRTRLYATENNVERCGVINTSIHHIDALELPRNPVFTKILLDAPCSGNYVTDPQWFNRRTLKDILNNAELQRRLLTCAVDLLEIGGILVYSTCSLEPEENELNIQWLLENHDVKLTKLDGPGEQGLSQIMDQKIDSGISFCRRFWPEKTRTQGFFIAKAVKQ